MPVFVARPGVVRAEWLGGVPGALGGRVELRQTLKVDLDRRGDVDERMRELLARGNRMAACELARTELGLSLAEAHGRVEELDRINQLLAARAPLVAIHGLGGIGKTQLALEYAYRLAADMLLGRDPFGGEYVAAFREGRLGTE